MTLFFAGNLFAFTPTFYVGDGVTGQATQCLTPNYNKITDALENIYSNNIPNSLIILCEGTYKEDVFLSSELGITLMGENENVILEGLDNENSVISILYGKNFFLKNLKINSDSLYGIFSIQSENINLEDIEINLSSSTIQDENSSGINFSYSDNVTLKNKIEINVSSKDKDKITGITINNSQVSFEAEDLIIENLFSTNNSAIIYGLEIIDSEVDLKENIKIKNISGLEAIGILIDNSEINNTSQISINSEKIDSMSISKGIEIKNNSQININGDTIINLLEIGNGNSEAYGLFLENTQIPSFGEISLYDIRGDYISKGIYIKDTDAFFIKEIIFSENKTNDQTTFVEIINSSGDISDIYDSEESFTNYEKFKFLHLKENSDIRINKFNIYSGDAFPECLYVEENSIIEITNGNFQNCLLSSIKNKDSEIILRKTSNFNPNKLLSFQSNNSKIEVYKPVNLSFYKNGSKINLDLIKFYNEDGYSSNIFLQNKSDLKIDLLYYKIYFEDGIADAKEYKSYSVKAIYDRINENPEYISLNGYQEASYNIDVKEMPTEFIEMRAKDGEATEISNHFSVVEKECSLIEKDTYKCYDIKKSDSINGTDYEIDFKIPVSWIIANEFKGNKIFLYHYENGSYKKLDTEKKEMIDNYQKYTAKIDSFSEFKIGGEETEESSNNSSSNGTTENTTSTENNSVDNNTIDENITVPDNNIITPQENIPTEECNITCDPDYEYLDIDNCECIDISDRLGCRIECGPGYTVDRENCKCVQIVLEGVKTGTKFFNGVFYIILIIIIVVLSILLLKKKKIKNKKTKKKTKK
jgi:PGF-pre-PGF domain-containing protein